MLLQNNMQEANCDRMIVNNDDDDEDEHDDEASEDEDDEDARFLDVCIDGDVEDLDQLLEEMARAGETLGPEILNCLDHTGRVS